MTGTAPSASAHRQAAQAAADAAGVEVRLLTTVAEFTEVSELFQVIWAAQDESSPVNVETLRALSKAGSYIGGAYDGDELVGACFGFFASPGRRALHSHIAGVSERMRGRSVGFALKVHQRSWAIDEQLDEISWTFDPLISRNAYFNLVKLAATGTAYHQNFYGQMNDALNGGDDTDRLLVTWYVHDPRVVAACAGEPEPPAETPLAAPLLSVGTDLAPVHHATAASVVRVTLPRDIERLRITDPELATRWRLAVRETLGTLLEGGARVLSFDRTGTYTIDRGEHHS
ncbi:GNAT family N-acetyltransferase [Microbacterium sp. p3-SID336]|uniref:GNAT family N-acetyltransferase n=1 Tax=Microbacterium sp. p3-SID336 TaxID=2916212 RepID=UPI0021A7FBD5|nr:GNAT family N-acetyltransferase [Microbacterium sp. p3-SID336]MCT1479242.1 GNAT family N-acetyltransferase [Microbacterium sp. p3-SID336]